MTAACTKEGFHEVKLCIERFALAQHIKIIHRLQHAVAEAVKSRG